MNAEEFLDDVPGPRPWNLPAGAPNFFRAENFFLGQGRHALEVAVAGATRRPGITEVRAVWSGRQGRTPSPLLLAVVYPDGGDTRVALCGPVGEDPPVYTGVEPSRAKRICEAALAEADRHAATRFLLNVLPEADSDLPGLRNVGMFATHELTSGVPRQADWTQMNARGRELLAKRGRDLVVALGFDVEQRGITTHVLRVHEDGRACAVAVFLNNDESLEATSARFRDASPVSTALARADTEGLPYVVLTRGNHIRVYAAGTDIGVGRKGRAETYVEANLALLPEDRAGYLPLLFGADALRPNGSFEQILERSRDFAADMGSRLRDRVYTEVVPLLATALGRDLARVEDVPAEDLDLHRLYEITMRVLFRLLFVAYAEDKGLLPYEASGAYRRHALKTKARELAERANDGGLHFDVTSTAYWDEILILWRSIDKGNTDWQVPAYNGGLFSSDRETNPLGAAIERMSLTNAQYGPALFALLVDQSAEGVFGPVDYRALSVREFGTIYEGLLESSLAVAPTDLALDRESRYVPAGPGTQVVVGGGEVYLQNRSGARKSSGSYFTKHFAVEHLMANALEPALDDHLQRLRALLAGGDEVGAAEAFFDFRCADVSMGSGHFLVAAVDHIEVKLSTFLAAHPLPNVMAELERLRSAATSQLGELAEGVEIEQSSLLRRQIARRCIYGVDVNDIAVELARLSLWIHTFVPGLPLSFLNHNLVCGNSLTGIGTIEEALTELDPQSGGAVLSLFRDAIEAWLTRAEESLRRLGRAAEATAAEVREARHAHEAALRAVQPAENLFDLLIATRLGEASHPADMTDEAIARHPNLDRAGMLARELQALHLPIAFPEVFLRGNGGFDCIVGNPPWEKLHVEEHQFWGRYLPGVRGLPVQEMNARIQEYQREHPELLAMLEHEVETAERMREVLAKGPYPQLGRGHPDLYKAFTWRFWELCRNAGFIGVVLPRSALMAAGSEQWRETVLRHGSVEDATILLNSREWVFDGVEPRYTIGLLSIRKKPDGDRVVRLRGPYASASDYSRGLQERPTRFNADTFADLLPGAAFPLLPTPGSADIFRKMAEHPRFDAGVNWKARPVQGDLNATTGKPYMLLDPQDQSGLWPVYTGASFDLWNSDTGNYYAWAEPERVTRHLQERRLGQMRNSRSAFSELPAESNRDPGTLPCRHPRIAFRDVTRSTDSRTVRCALVPPELVLVHIAPYLLFTTGTRRDEAFVLGVLSSVPLDWYARRVVETHVTFTILNAFPVPRPGQDDPLRRRVEIIAGRLAAVDESYESWANEVGVPVASVSTDEEKDDLVAELDALVAKLYGLSENELVHLFETFHEGWDYAARLNRVIQHSRRLSTEA